MPLYKTTKPYTPEVGEQPKYFGYNCKIIDDKVYADVPKEMAELELKAGRILPLEISKIEEPAKEAVEKEIFKSKKDLSAKEVVEGTGKRSRGRPKTNPLIGDVSQEVTD